MKIVAVLVLFWAAGCTLASGKKADALGAAAAPRDLTPAAAVFGPNLLALGNVDLSDSAVQGRLAAGGDVQLTEYAVGTALTADPDRCDLDVAGSLEFERGSVRQGKICVAGAVHSTEVGAANPGGAMLLDDFRSLSASAESLSASLAALPSAQTIDAKYMNGGAARLVLTGSDPTLNVFMVTQDALALGTGLLIQAPEGSSAVVNITGSAVVGKDLGMVLAGLSTDRVLLNFPEASTLSLDGAGLTASLLAPKAAMTFNNGTVTGSVVVDSATGNGRYNLFPYTGALAVKKP